MRTVYDVVAGPMDDEDGTQPVGTFDSLEEAEQYLVEEGFRFTLGGWQRPGWIAGILAGQESEEDYQFRKQSERAGPAGLEPEQAPMAPGPAQGYDSRIEGESDE